METPFELEVQGFEPSSHLREQIADTLTFAVNDVFRRADRQLRDYVSRMRGRPTVRESSPKGKVIRLDPSGEFGFLETEDGREIYLHAHSVLDGKFDRMKPGMSVAFHEEAGEMGPRASTVRMV